MADKQDSNLTGLSIAEETTLRVLPTSPAPVWRALEPNSYSDFGGQLATVARNPINPSRQRKKGAVTDLDASGGFNQDVTTGNLTRLMQGFLFANAREKASSQPLNGTAVPCTSVTAADDKYNFGSDPGAFVANDLIYASGFTNAANNGLKRVVSTDADDVTVPDGLVNEASPPAAAKLVVVGRQFGSETSDITLNGNLVRMTDSATDMTTLGLVVGEWVYVGGDAQATRFDSNQGFARVSAIAAGYLEFDKVSWPAQAEDTTGTGKTVQLFFGTVIKNESNPDLIVRRSYQIERTLGDDGVGEQSEYLVGAVPNEMTINIPTADKVNVDFTFVALDNEQRTGTTGVKTGTREAAIAGDALNTSSDFSRIALSLVSTTDATVTPLVAYSREITLTVNNNVTALKAIGTLGGFEVNTGTFEVGGNVESYFGDVGSVQAVRNNSDVTLDFAVVKSNSGILFDLPLIALGDGRLNVEQDQPIILPLESSAFESAFGHTLLYQAFTYLPTAAELAFVDLA